MVGVYRDADGKRYYYEDEEAARAVNKAISDAGLEGKRRMNAVDATGALVPKVPGASHWATRDRSAVVAPDPARAPTETTSVLGRDVGQARATVEGGIHRRERQAALHRALRHAGGRRARRQRGDQRASSRRPSSAQYEPGRRRPIGAARA